MRFLLLFIFGFTFVHANSESDGGRISSELQELKEVQTSEKAQVSKEISEVDEFDQFDSEFSEHDKAMNEIFDPLSGYNSWMTGVNDTLMINVVEPASDGYRYVVPEQGRRSVNNFFKNLYYPVSLVNNLLQLEVVDSGTETARFLINTTIGILGLFDPADAWFDIKPKVEDFGQTLGYYGTGSGFPVVLPFFGQRNLRDITGTVVDSFVDPLYYSEDRFYNTVEENWQSVLLKGYDDFNEYSLTPGAYPKLTEDAVELYPFLRDAYEQHRNQLIKE